MDTIEMEYDGAITIGNRDVLGVFGRYLGEI